MKKIISILLTALLLFSTAVAVGASLAPTEYEYTEIANDENNYVANIEEMYSTNARHMTQQYSLTGGGRADQSTNGTTVLIDTNADGTYETSDIAFRYILTGAGKEGDHVLMNYGLPVNGTDNGGDNPGTQYFLFPGYLGSHANAAADYWHMPNIVKNKVYQFTLRIKAPAYVTDPTMEADNVLYVDKATGSVKVKSAMTNGMIGAPLSFRFSTNGLTPADFSMGTFTGYLDNSGNYVPFTAPGAEYTAALLQSEYVDYVGYFVAKGQTKGITGDAYQRTIVSVDNTGEGLWYIDEMSVKEMAFTNGNLAQNGNFSIVSGTQAFLYEDNATVGSDATHGNILNVAQGAETKQVPVAGMISGTEYTISFYAKSAAANGTAYANIITDSVPAELKDDTQTLAADWQKYEFDFTYNGGEVKFSIGADCTDLFSIADIRILEKAANINNKFTDISISGDVIEKHTISVNFTYVTDQTPYYIVKISSGNDSTGYTEVYEDVLSTQTTASYTISSADVGKKLMVEVFAMGDTGEPLTVSKITSDVVAPELSVTPAFTGYNVGSRTLSATVTTINNSVEDEPLEFFVALVVYDAEECKVCNIVYKEDITVTADTGADVQTIRAVIPSDKVPDEAKLFVWSGSDIYNTDMTALTDVLTYDFQ